MKYSEGRHYRIFFQEGGSPLYIDVLGISVTFWSREVLLMAFGGGLGPGRHLYIIC